jgi:hypothetical protein
MNNTHEQLGEVKKLPYTAIQAQIKFLQGKILTVVEASYVDTTQRKAIKDLVNKMFSEQLTWISQLCYPDVNMQSRGQVEESAGS